MRCDEKLLQMLPFGFRLNSQIALRTYSNSSNMVLCYIIFISDHFLHTFLSIFLNFLFLFKIYMHINTYMSFFLKLKTEFSNVINTLNLIGNNIDNFKKRVKTAIIFAFFKNFSRQIM